MERALRIQGVEGAMSLAARLPSALRLATRHLLGLMHAEGYWEGYLSSSALSTATALSALALAADPADVAKIAAGRRWLAQTQNADGGWGDTPDSPSNLSTTLLAACALRLTGAGEEPDAGAAALRLAEKYITARAGSGVSERVAAIGAIYGADRTFAVPILMNCALAGLVPWTVVPPLPFELSLFPRGFYKALRLHVVSYALPALIAVGLLIHRRNPASNRFRRLIRDRAAAPALRLLLTLQPASGGFLEATPLTSFVAMSLIPVVGPQNPVAAHCLSFLRQSARSDGSWPIDTNLAVWATTGAIGALTQAGAINPEVLDGFDAARTRRWIAARQWRRVHPFTGAAPGGFAWTHLAGGVPDADDTAGAILALAQLGERQPLGAAVDWLLGLQNSDGGWPTFCRGWGKLPFDQSSPDLTAHVLRALRCFDPDLQRRKVARAVRRGFHYLEATQRGDGSWLPLWFGNQFASQSQNPVLGTARVLLAWIGLDGATHGAGREMGQETNWRTARGIAYLVAAQHAEGGWGGCAGAPVSVEETALAVAALARYPGLPVVRQALEAGVAYLARRVEDGSWLQPAPIGLYFANLWYTEQIYPVIWTIEALGAAGEVLQIERT